MACCCDPVGCLILVRTYCMFRVYETWKQNVHSATNEPTPWANSKKMYRGNIEPNSQRIRKQFLSYPRGLVSAPSPTTRAGYPVLVVLLLLLRGSFCYDRELAGIFPYIRSRRGTNEIVSAATHGGTNNQHVCCWCCGSYTATIGTLAKEPSRATSGAGLVSELQTRGNHYITPNT